MCASKRVCGCASKRLGVCVSKRVCVRECVGA